MMIRISQLMIPLVTLAVVLFGLRAGRPVFEDFIRGAKKGLRTAAEIAPTLCGLMAATGLLRASGFLETLGRPWES